MWFLVLSALALGFYLLYRNGLMPVKSLRALSFVGSMYGKNRCGASFTACTGSVTRIIRLPESGTSPLTLESDLQKGSLEVLILDGAGRPLLVLNEGVRTGTVTGNGRCRLIIRFQAASGSFTLHWDPENTNI